MHSLFLLQLIQAVLVAIQLVMIFSANKVKREWLTVGQLCIAIVILADLFSELLFFRYTTVLTGFVLFLQLFLLPMFWKQLKAFEE
ncbi:hypothetical protein H5S40_06125 [Limosilactobacillus sp. RRLNB_1_1]|uniref:Uncharacterized protein n=2 Tax=Limosilactobacillus TaxID=2742598 RepID=A0A7W3TS82_9LACO|nr:MULTISPECIES: hypothetical protein [Limosilactobacillus]MRH47185.1 hypothetical protein [Limosilactobacillus reuteri]MBB1069726.1 hypothetical protein [Limosilactobacillus albertensis]MBB1124437.1 hypothetical protein [Limosilactobacillus albertensis]MCD7117812.1 hypothetical protein [Limosilactobacillus albertensis]MCD7123149.1 hypothetical protein [Limosilactobacillus albertensis]